MTFRATHNKNFLKTKVRNFAYLHGQSNVDMSRQKKIMKKAVSICGDEWLWMTKTIYSTSFFSRNRFLEVLDCWLKFTIWLIDTHIGQAESCDIGAGERNSYCQLDCGVIYE